MRIDCSNIDSAPVERPCVYLLFVREHLAYVGTTIKPLNRFKAHRRWMRNLGHWEFSILPFWIGEEFRRQTESMLILELKPVLNGTGLTRLEFCDRHAALRKLLGE